LDGPLDRLAHQTPVDDAAHLGAPLLRLPIPFEVAPFVVDDIPPGALADPALHLGESLEGYADREVDPFGAEPSARLLAEVRPVHSRLDSPSEATLAQFGEA